MNCPEGEIFIGDLARAFAAIGVSDREVAVIVARLLGFDLELVQTGPPPADVVAAEPDTQASSLREEVNTLEAEASPDAGGQDRFTGRPPLPELRPDKVRKEEQLGHQTSVTGFNIEHLSATPPPRPKKAPYQSRWGRPPAVKFPHQPLLTPEWTRGILSEAVATWRETTAPDLRRMVEVLARGGALDRLPRAKVRTLARGCQVLSDASPGMAPFAKDNWQIIQSLRTMVGHELVEVLYFEDCPIFGVETDPDLDFVSYRPPPRGTLILLITDLGISNPPFSLRRSTVRNWLEWLSRLKETGCPVVALVPYPPSRWPPALARGLPIIQLDRRTTAIDVRGARRKN
jgi:hypothetical protein